jgi:hypothetical protein
MNNLKGSFFMKILKRAIAKATAQNILGKNLNKIMH